MEPAPVLKIGLVLVTLTSVALPTMAPVEPTRSSRPPPPTLSVLAAEAAATPPPPPTDWITTP